MDIKFIQAHDICCYFMIALYKFYSPELYPFQLGLCPRVPFPDLHLPQPLNDMMMMMEISQGKLSSLLLIKLSEQAKLFKNHVATLSIYVSDGYLAWWTDIHTSLVPVSLTVPGFLMFMLCASH